MTDQYGRIINYMRLSITDRCNLRCRYCMPEGICWVPQEERLTYGEMLRVAGQAVTLGITKFKVTGGEPLTRPGCVDFIRDLKQLPGVEQVTMTSNGLLLPPLLDQLCAAGLDGLNLSLDTLDEGHYRRLTGYAGEGVSRLLGLIEQCTAKQLHTKINVVLLRENQEELEDLGALAAQFPVDVRFIELMPIGLGTQEEHIGPEVALDKLKRRWPDLHPVSEKRGNGPAHYYAAQGLQGRIGLIDAVSHSFCQTCNRVRLTSTGWLKPCLCYQADTDLKPLLRGGGPDEVLREAMRQAITQKPRAHCFSDRDKVTELRKMSQIGG